VSVAAQGRRIEAKNVYRFGFFVLAVAIGVSALSARMLYMQVLQGQKTNSGGDTQPTGTVTVPSTRGLIYDASGLPLVRNVIDYAATVTPSDLPLDREQDVAAKLGSILNMDPTYIVTQIDSAPGSLYEPVKIADGIDAKVARFIEENSDALPGVKIEVLSKRQYLTPELLAQHLTPELFAEIIGYEGQITRSQLGSQINDTGQGPLSADQYNKLKTLGYSGQDVVGQAGLEVQYEQDLRGVYGTQKVGVDAAGKPIPGLAGQVEGKVAGSSLTLNIDTKEQKLANEALAWGMTNAGIQQGTIIVENPQNGKILAMVSLPSYDNQAFADGISETDFQKLLADKNQPLLNKAIAQYAPGSTYKLVTATAGLSGVPAQLGSAGHPPIAAQPPAITTRDTLLSQPYIQIGAYKFWEWNKIGWGPLNIVEGLSYSSDTFFYQLSELLGGPLEKWDPNVAIDNLAYWARQYGFGAKTKVDLPGEAPGIVPDTAWKKTNKGEDVFPGEVLLAGIGQGFDASTPLQVLNAYCALANGGNLWTPQIVKSVTSPGGTPDELQPQLIRRLDITPQNLATLRQGMRDVVTTRHTGNLTDLPIKIAGKTGTAEFGVPDRAGNLPYHEWFVGWVPANPTVDDFTKSDSQLAVIAFVYGANTRGNVATEIVKYYMWKHFKLPGNLFSNPNLGYGGIDMYSLKPGLFYGRD
jgi:penicillin-binding protein 2